MSQDPQDPPAGPTAPGDTILSYLPTDPPTGLVEDLPAGPVEDVPAGPVEDLPAGPVENLSANPPATDPPASDAPAAAPAPPTGPPSELDALRAANTRLRSHKSAKLQEKEDMVRRLQFAMITQIEAQSARATAPVRIARRR